MAKKSLGGSGHTVATIRHADKRKNIPTAEYQAVLKTEEQKPVEIRYRRNRDLDPQLMWRGKDEQDWSDLVVHAPPVYIQEKVHPKVLIDDLLRRTKDWRAKESGHQANLFGDFNGLPKNVDKTEFYHHDQNWSNRMILGDSLQVMASLTEREGLRGKVQCIYLDPPYGIGFNSNFQWSTGDKSGTTNDSTDKISREPEQVKAFRDTWRDGVHSYLTYLRDRFTACRDLLTDTGSIFVQMSTENLQLVALLLDEVFGAQNRVELISFRKKTMPLGGRLLEGNCDYLLWYARDKERVKYRTLFQEVSVEGDMHWNYVELPSGARRQMSSTEVRNHKQLEDGSQVYQLIGMYPTGVFSTGIFPFEFEGTTYELPPGKCWRTPIDGMRRLTKAQRLQPYTSGETLRYILKYADYPVSPLNTVWSDTSAPSDKVYVVQTSRLVVQRCLLMTTDPGDLVLDPTCGSGTTAYIAEQWGRRWITVDSSRVALALARARIMGARYPFYLLADSRDGQAKEAELSQSAPSTQPVHGDIRHGFVYERVPHITLKFIANHPEIDVIWEKHQVSVESILGQLNTALKKKWREWEVPRDAQDSWSDASKNLHAKYWDLKLARQKEIDASISAKAEYEYLYDKPYEDKKTVRVAGPFTVESLSPHRTLGIGADDELLDVMEVKDSARATYGVKQAFPDMILENLQAAGVQQAHKEDRIAFKSIARWPGAFVCAEGRYMEGDVERRAGIFIGPEFGTVQRVDLVAAAREAGEAGFDILVSCAFNYEAHTTEFNKLGRLPVLKARMNADLHMAADLKNTGKGNLFVVFGEPDVTILTEKDGRLRVKVNGVDVFKPQTGEVVSDSADGIACWFVDTDYNEESFFVRHAYFLGANDPYSALKTTLKAEIDPEEWASLRSDTSRPFNKPSSGRIAVKVINHLGDEVMKVFKV